MPLKATLASKAEVDALPEALRGFYTEVNGKFVLDVDDVNQLPKVVDINAKLTEFRENNRTLNTKVGELDALKTKIELFKDVDPDEYRRMKAEFDKLPKGKEGDKPDLAKTIQDAIAAAVTPLKTALETEKAERQKAQQAADRSKFSVEIAAAARNVKAKPNAITMIEREAESVFQVVDGKLVAKDGQFSKENAGNPLGVEEWLGGLAKSHDYLFEPSTGSGTPLRPGAPPAATRELKDPDAMEFGKNLEDIASGKVAVT